VHVEGSLRAATDLVVYRSGTLDDECGGLDIASMNSNDQSQPTPRQLLDAIVSVQETVAENARLQDIMAGAIGRIELRLGTAESNIGTLTSNVSVLMSNVSVLISDVSVLKSDVAVLKSDVAVLKSDVREIKGDIIRLERRVIRIDDRISVIENLNVGPTLADHERRISRLEGFAS